MSEEIIYADAFGGNFPVCSEQDKVAIEAGFKKAMAWAESEEGKAYENRPTECSCAIIGRLLNGTATYGDMMMLGAQMARQLYSEKRGVVALMQLIDGLENRMMRADPVMGAAPKKEWVN